MLNTVPITFWETPHSVFEPCCGKGNFVLAIFDKFYIGLKNIYPDSYERCKVIATECLYFSDINALDIFITCSILKCHIQNYCKNCELDYEFNSNIGDTLKLDIKKKWNINDFHATIGNPPYNKKGGIRGGGKNLYTPFTLNAIKNTKKMGYILVIVPTGILKTTIYNKKTELFAEITQHTICSININECAKHFKVASTFTYILINKDYSKNNTINKIICEVNNNKYCVDKLVFDTNFIPIISTPESFSILNKCKKENLNLKRVDKTEDIKNFPFDKFLYIKRLDHINYKKPFLKIFTGDKTLKISGPILYTTYSKNKELLLNSRLMAFFNIITRFDGVIYHNFMNMFGIEEEITLNNDTDIYKYFDLTKKEIELIDTLTNKNNLIEKNSEINNNIPQTEQLFNEKLNSFPRRKKPYYEILDKYQIKYTKNNNISQLKDLIINNKIEKNIQL